MPENRNVSKLRRDPRSKRHATDQRIALKRIELGWIGLVFGGVSEKPGNIAAVLLISYLMISLVASILPFAAPLGAVRTLEGLATLALGYLFGRRFQ